MGRVWQKIGLGVLAGAVAVLAVISLRSSPAPVGGIAPLPTSTPTALPATLEAARGVLASSKAVTICVLGDSTGVSDLRWVHLWAEHLGKSRAVTLHQWNSVLGSWVPTAEKFGKRGGRVTIWNMSEEGVTPVYTTVRMGVAAPVRPDLLILSYGHNGSPGMQQSWLTGLATAVQLTWPGRHVPTVVILQNPETGSRAAAAAAAVLQVRAWADANQDPTVDVGAAFSASGQLAALTLPGGVLPSAAGSLLWARTVAKALG